MTNFERVKQMDINSLAKEFLKDDYCEKCTFCDKDGICNFVKKHPDKPLNSGCMTAVIGYLNSEAEAE